MNTKFMLGMLVVLVLVAALNPVGVLAQENPEVVVEFNENNQFRFIAYALPNDGVALQQDAFLDIPGTLGEFIPLNWQPAFCNCHVSDWISIPENPRWKVITIFGEIVPVVLPDTYDANISVINHADAMRVEVSKGSVLYLPLIINNR